MIDKSPLDILNEIHFMLTELNARVILIEKRLGLAESKAVAPNQESLVANMKQLEAGQKTVGVPFNDAPTISVSSTNVLAKVHGKVLSPDQKPMHNVAVLVKSQKGDTVKQLKTSKGGEWATNLAPGKYALTYTREKMTPVYRFVEVKPGLADVEVV